MITPKSGLGAARLRSSTAKSSRSRLRTGSQGPATNRYSEPEWRESHRKYKLLRDEFESEIVVQSVEARRSSSGALTASSRRQKRSKRTFLTSTLRSLN
jgi:hypothetical protein